MFQTLAVKCSSTQSGGTLKGRKEEETSVKGEMQKKGEVGKRPGTPAGQSKPNAHRATSPGINWASVYRVTLDQVLQGAWRVIM